MDQILVEAPGYLSLRLMYTCTRVTLNKDDIESEYHHVHERGWVWTYLCIDYSTWSLYSVVQRVKREQPRKTVTVRYYLNVALVIAISL
jgi:hypothetical protein